jgi:signal transduction histidine kinase
VPAVAEAADVDQILDNLIDNAITYAPGPISVRTTLSKGEGSLAVTDRGEGIAPQDLELVTERFYRGAGTLPGGSGLGLAIARQLAERWGGRLTVSSPAGGGTSVEVAFPADGDGISET